MVKKARKPYQKPMIKEVNLTPQEAVLQTCKVTTASAGPNDTCRTGGGSCKNPGAAS